MKINDQTNKYKSLIFITASELWALKEFLM